MYSCPRCGSERVLGLGRCACGEDLSALRDLHAVADSWFNQGLAAAKGGALGEALEWFAACVAARPEDASARRCLAKLWEAVGCPSEALRNLELSDPVSLRPAGELLLQLPDTQLELEPGKSSGVNPQTNDHRPAPEPTLPGASVLQGEPSLLEELSNRFK